MRSRWLLTLLGVGLWGAPAWAADLPQIPPPIACPDRLEDLTPLLLRDLPSYANRVTQRSFRASLGAEVNREAIEDRPGYVVLAGRPEFEPLSLGPGQYAPTEPSEGAVQQLFFTTLERQYIYNRPVNFQHYHWLFLARSDSGWWLVSLFSRIGDRSGAEPPTPPRDASQGAIGQAVRLWLRDCRAGAVRQSVDP